MYLFRSKSEPPPPPMKGKVKCIYSLIKKYLVSSKSKPSHPPN